MQLEDNQDKSDSEDSSFNRYSQTSSRIGIESQTDIDAGYNTDERKEIKQVPNFLLKTFEIVNVSWSRPDCCRTRRTTSA